MDPVMTRPRRNGEAYKGGVAERETGTKRGPLVSPAFRRRRG